MRRLLPFGLLLLLPGCDYVGNPLVGFADFISDTLTFHTNPNRPDSDAPNVKRATGVAVVADPLLPEEGHVWPGPLPPTKTLADLQKDTSGLEPDVAPMRGSSSSPTTVSPNVPALKITPAPLSQPVPPKPQSRVFQTPTGPAISTIGGNGVETFTSSNGMMGTVINNGNGTATLVRSDGVSTVVPMPR